MTSPKSRTLEALAQPTVEYSIRLTQSQREWLSKVMKRQVEDEQRDAFWNYFIANQATIRPKLMAVGAVKLTLEEVNYLLFTMGGVMAAGSMVDKALQWQITEQLIKARQ